MKKSFLYLADGFEEIEALATVDVLRRGGIAVRMVSINGKREVKGAHDITVLADDLLADTMKEDIEIMILPGGMLGALNLSECKPFMKLLDRQYAAGKWIAAICAAPAMVLSKLPLDRYTRVTCYPGFEEYLSGVKVSEEGVVVYGNIITAKGPAYAASFGLEILSRLTDSDQLAGEVADGLLL